MHDDTNNKKPASATTSSGAQRPDNLSEAEYLRREADDAKGAISRTLEQMRGSFKDAGDVRAWARTYPWATLGAAAAAGFLVAGALVPKRRRAEDRDPALLERILTDEQITARLRQLAAEDESRSSGPSAVRTFVNSLVSTFGPAVQSAVTAAIAASASQPAPPEMQPPGEASDEAESPQPPPA